MASNDTNAQMLALLQKMDKNTQEMKEQLTDLSERVGTLENKPNDLTDFPTASHAGGSGLEKYEKRIVPEPVHRTDNSQRAGTSQTKAQAAETTPTWTLQSEKPQTGYQVGESNDQTSDEAQKFDDLSVDNDSQRGEVSHDLSDSGAIAKDIDLLSTMETNVRNVLQQAEELVETGAIPDGIEQLKVQCQVMMNTIQVMVTESSDILKVYGSDYFTSLVATVQSLIEINIIASEYFVYDYEKTQIFLDNVISTVREEQDDESRGDITLDSTDKGIIRQLQWWRIPADAMFDPDAEGSPMHPSMELVGSAEQSACELSPDLWLRHPGLTHYAKALYLISKKILHMGTIAFEYGTNSLDECVKNLTIDTKENSHVSINLNNMAL